MPISKIKQQSLDQNVAGNGPVVYVDEYNTQSVANATDTKLVFGTKQVDSHNCFNNTASTVTLNGISVPSYSFAPPVAGWYWVSIQTRCNEDANYTGEYSMLFKNGSLFKRLYEWSYPSAASTLRLLQKQQGMLVYMNGTSDYLSAYVYQTNTASAARMFGYGASMYNNHFQAFLVRAA